MVAYYCQIERENMPKKSRKRRARNASYTQGALSEKTVGQHVEPSIVLSNEQVVATRFQGALSNQVDRYRYVSSDLKRALLIAGSLFIVLIVLSFIL